MSSTSALVGFFSRTSLVLVTVSGLYVLGLSQLGGSVLHDMHLLWFSALLSVGPSGDALSVDRWLAVRRGIPAPGASLAVAAPLLGVRVLLGLVYFFPGFWKLYESGWSWIWSDNLRNQMYWKWYQNGAVPFFRIDHWGGLLGAGALGVVALELSFPVLVLLPRTRIVAAVGGLLFHAFSQLFLFIPFLSLWGCYTALVDFGPRGEKGGEHKIAKRALIAPATLAALLVLAVAIQGARNAVQAWPFACYPTFQWKVGSAIPELAFEAVLPDGTGRVVPDGPGTGGALTQEEWGIAWHVAGVRGNAPSAGELHAYFRRRLEKPVARDAAADAARRGARTVRVYRAWYSVVPAHRGRPPIRAELLGEIPL